MVVGIDQYGNYICEMRLRKQASHKDYGVVGINFLENLVSWHDVSLNTQCNAAVNHEEH